MTPSLNDTQLIIPWLTVVGKAYMALGADQCQYDSVPFFFDVLSPFVTSTNAAAAEMATTAIIEDIPVCIRQEEIIAVSERLATIIRFCETTLLPKFHKKTHGSRFVRLPKFCSR